LWAVGAAAVVVLVVAFLLIAKPFGGDEAGSHDADSKSDTTSARTDRDNASDEAAPTGSGVNPGRVAPGTGGLPAPGGTRSADPSSWATSICSAIDKYKQSSNVLSDNVDDAIDSSVSQAKMSALAEQSNGLLSQLRSTLATIVDAGGNKSLAKVQAAVTAATDDAAAKVDPDSPTNENQSTEKFGAKIKEALSAPTTTFRSEVDDLDKQDKQAITDTAACAPLDL